MRLIIALVLGFAVSFSGMLAMRAEAAPSQESETYYYSDSAFTNQVGYEFWGCDNERYLDGEKTVYKKVSWSSCSNSGSGVGCYVCTLDHVCVGTTCP
jgi:hypothetical protein